MDFESNQGGVTACPLVWPNGWKRSRSPSRAQFQTRFATARDGLFNELKLMGARAVTLSTNVPLRLDGLPYANMAQPSDRGAAVYFQLKGKPMVFACDRWAKVEDNVQAIRKSVEAVRGLDRWGASEMLERAFRGFQALPAPPKWWQVLNVERGAPWWNIQQQWKSLAFEFHPDRGGSAEQMARVNEAYQAAKAERGEE